MDWESLKGCYECQSQSIWWALEAFERFGKKLAEIEDNITNLNNDEKLKNRVGKVKVPYTLLFPTGESGIAGKGIPNSVSI